MSQGSRLRTTSNLIRLAVEGSATRRWLALLVLAGWSVVAYSQEAPGFLVERYEIVGENPLDAAATAKILAPHIGLKHSLDELGAAAQALEKGLRAKGLVFYKVTLPPQTIENKTVQLALQPLKIGAINVSGNQFVSADNARRALPQLKSGETPALKSLSRGLSLANDHPVRHLALNLKESPTPGTIDAELQVEDARPWSIFTNLTNVGTKDLARLRLSVGAQHANLFDRDHTFTVIYTTAPEKPADVKQFAMNYRIPWYAVSGVASAYYAHSDVDSGRIQDVFDVSGAGDFYGFAYSQYLSPLGQYKHQAGIGLDDRGFSNNIAFLGRPIGNDVRSRPINARYQGEYRGDNFVASFNASYVHNTGGGHTNDARSYTLARAGAKPNWDVFRYGAQVTVALPKGWQTRGVFEAQEAGEPLIPGEQFGVGGANSVRGFEERGVTGDEGQRASWELWTPSLPYDFRLLGFLDAGHVDRENTLPGEFGHDVIVSAGAGARWQWRKYLAVAVDYGHSLSAANDPSAGGVKWNFSILLRY